MYPYHFDSSITDLNKSRTAMSKPKKIIARGEIIPLTVKNTIWCKYVGNIDETKCFCCSVNSISRKNFECGFVCYKIDVSCGNVNIHNLRPICTLCCESVDTYDLRKFMKKYGYERCKNWEGIPTDNETEPENILKNDFEELKNCHKLLRSDFERLNNDNERLKNDNKKLNSHDELKNHCNTLTNEYNKLKNCHEKLKDEYNKLKNCQEKLKNNNENLNNKLICMLQNNIKSGTDI